MIRPRHCSRPSRKEWRPRATVMLPALPPHSPPSFLRRCCATLLLACRTAGTGAPPCTYPEHVRPSLPATVGLDVGSISLCGPIQSSRGTDPQRKPSLRYCRHPGVLSGARSAYRYLRSQSFSRFIGRRPGISPQIPAHPLFTQGTGLETGGGWGDGFDHTPSHRSVRGFTLCGIGRHLPCSQGCHLRPSRASTVSFQGGCLCGSPITRPPKFGTKAK